ncbi:MAG TPA: hypothetical protein VLQ45_29835 [Thermoanaerobaculia bacterium]|nr:hypothetical protein [Thermoanaerobaculia bacterium]
MAKPNYSFEKRQKDIAKKKKQEEKRQRKLERERQNPDAKGEPEPTGDAGNGETAPQG